MYEYYPEKGFFGVDKAQFLVETMHGRKVLVNYTLSVGDTSEDLQDGEVCPQPSWEFERLRKEYNGKVSLPNGVDFVDLELTLLDVDYNYRTITFRDLTGAAIGETTGTDTNATITLDTDAAGHGWYEGGMFSLGDLGLDANFNSSLSPALSQGARGLNDISNWLPTSNPNEWVARAGTAAEGKMDMLSVLLHEYGHALGIEHSADSHDYMATTLTPGMRRLPNSDEMQLMAQLAAEAREAIVAGQGYTLTVANGNTDSPTPSPTLPISMGFGISFLGLLRRNSTVGWGFNPTQPANAAPAQYDIAANATHVNGNFAITPTPTLPLTGGGGLSGWETTGKVNANNGAAVLSEVSTSQTRLNQVFVVGADDRYLSFTLSNIGLEDVNTGPDDAF